MRKHYIQRGWPRGTAGWRKPYTTRCPELPAKLPVPWINGPTAKADGDFHSFRENALESARARNCIICGLKIEGDVFIAAMNGKRETSGHGGHARCILLAVTRCPHMVDLQKQYEEKKRHPKSRTVAWRYKGPGTGVILPKHRDLDGWGMYDRVVKSAKAMTLEDLKEAARLTPC